MKSYDTVNIAEKLLTIKNIAEDAIRLEGKFNAGLGLDPREIPNGADQFYKDQMSLVNAILERSIKSLEERKKVNVYKTTRKTNY